MIQLYSADSHLATFAQNAKKNKNEIEANTFAVELLIPDKCIYEFKDTSVTINEVAQTYGVPEEMCNLKKIDHIR